jgi:archaeal flagellar protein FlaI
MKKRTKKPSKKKLRTNPSKSKVKNHLKKIKKNSLKRKNIVVPKSRGKTPYKKLEKTKFLIKSIKKETFHATPTSQNKSEKHIEKTNQNKYPIVIDGAKVIIEIKEENKNKTKTYNLDIPKINVATSALLQDMRNELITESTLNLQELSEQESFLRLKKKFTEETKIALKKKLPRIEKPTEDFLIGTLIQEMLGLGEIEFLINDPNLEEIVIPSSKENVRVYSKKHGWLKTNIKVPTEEKIINYANIIARRVGRQITVLNPLLDAHLISGDRINAVLHPINSKGNTITIRKFSRDPYTIIDFINNKTCSSEIAALLWLAVEYEMNILISGGTASGKTSFLNACMPFIPPNHRIISIEDTRELILPEFLYWTPMVTRTSNSEGKGEITMLQLLINSLRMRPDRIILGEMRKHDEAMVLFEAMHTGHSVYATVHADSAAETISRLVNPPLKVPPNLLKSVNLNVVMFRDRKKGLRRVLQLAEFEADGERATSNIIYRWLAEKDEIVKHNESSRFFEEVSRHTGLSQKDIKETLKERKNILNFLSKNNIRSIEKFGKIMDKYYLDKFSLIKLIKRGNKSNLFEE